MKSVVRLSFVAPWVSLGLVTKRERHQEVTVTFAESFQSISPTYLLYCFSFSPSSSFFFFFFARGCLSLFLWNLFVSSTIFLSFAPNHFTTFVSQLILPPPNSRFTTYTISQTYRILPLFLLLFLSHTKIFFFFSEPDTHTMYVLLNLKDDKMLQNVVQLLVSVSCLLLFPKSQFQFAHGHRQLSIGESIENLCPTCEKTSLNQATSAVTSSTTSPTTPCTPPRATSSSSMAAASPTYSTVTSAAVVVPKLSSPKREFVCSTPIKNGMSDAKVRF